MTSKTIRGLAEWLKGWFAPLNHASSDTTYGIADNSKYGHVLLEDSPSQNSNNAVKSGGIYTALAGKSDTSHPHGNINQNGVISGKNNLNVVTDSTGKITTEAKYSHPSTHATSMITESNALSNLNTKINDSQSTINSKINEIIGSLKTDINQLNGVDLIQIVSDKGTASKDTMGKLYIVSENNKINIYYTKQNGTAYEWHKMDADILDELSISWNDITNKPSSFTPSSHAVNANTYGLGSTSVYGHVKTINGLTQSTHSDGTALSAYQGKVLKDLIDGLTTNMSSKSDKSSTIKDIELVPKTTDATGAIKLIYADE